MAIGRMMGPIALWWSSRKTSNITADIPRAAVGLPPGIAKGAE